MISYILAIVSGVIILGVDQFTKYYIVSNFVPGGTAKFLDGFINILYTTNKGGAWGILEGYTWTLLAITSILMIVCFTLLLKLGKKNKMVFWAVSFVLFGGIGNMIDRIFRGGEVVDFLQFAFYPEFPVFNVADCAVVIGGILLIVYFVFDSINDAKQKKLKVTKEQKVENE